MSSPIKRRGRYKRYLRKDEIPIPRRTQYYHIAKGDYLTNLIDIHKTNSNIKYNVLRFI